MAPLTDPTTLAYFCEALGEWNCEGFVVWKRIPAEWLASNLQGETQRSVARLLHEYVSSGGVIDRQVEKRELHRDTHREHFDFRVSIESRLIYIETTLGVTSTGPTITIVSIHDA